MVFNVATNLYSIHLEIDQKTKHTHTKSFFLHIFSPQIFPICLYISTYLSMCCMLTISSISQKKSPVSFLRFLKCANQEWQIPCRGWGPIPMGPGRVRFSTRGTIRAGPRQMRSQGQEIAFTRGFIFGSP